jgi:dihydropteroate synthase
MPTTDTTAPPVVDLAVKEAVDIIGDWLPNTGDPRTLQDLVAEGVRRGYTLGYGAAS